LQLKDKSLKQKILAFIAMALFVLVLNSNINSQTTPTKKESKHWYETISLRGYMQLRYNRLFETNSKLKNEQADRSWGENGGISIRRGRLIFSGNLTDDIYFYIQPDISQTVGSTLNLFQIRDAYVDIGLNKNSEFRIRVGQSKVPYGFENMQSSQNRLTLDRSDALNSAVPNERDLGAFLYWRPVKTKELYANLIKENLKGSGDYGIFAFGVYNGQVANKPELNNSLHIVSRISVPIKIGSQLIEPGIQAYSGKYTIPTENLTSGVKVVKSLTFNDKRIAESFILYPKPFGLQIEYNLGKGPRYNPTRDSIESSTLKGGYVLLNYRIKGKRKEETFFPFSRYQSYNGGKKQELDARSYLVRELETGLEWQFNKTLELTASYVIANRKFEDSKLRTNDQKGRLLRLQIQVNF
jgi:hypothetical protein